MTATTQLNPTQHAGRDEYYIAEDQTCNCGHENPHLVGRNGSKGQRTSDHLCEDCIGELEAAPVGLYDVVVIAENPKHD